MKLLVTGGAGFIGSHYVRQALSGAYPGLADADVVVLDALTYAGSRTNLAPVADSPRLRFVHGDICNVDLVDGLVGEADQVVHFAAESHVDRSIVGAADFVRTNVLGHPDPARRGAPARGRAVRARVDRRGLRLDRVRLLAGNLSAAAELAVRGEQGQQ